MGQNVNRTYLWVMGLAVFLISSFVCVFKKTDCLCGSFAINKSYLKKVTMARDVAQLVRQKSGMVM